MRLAATKDAHRKSGFSLGLENLAKWEGIFQSGNLNKLEKSGKSHKILEKVWEFQINVKC